MVHKPLVVDDIKIIGKICGNVPRDVFYWLPEDHDKIEVPIVGYTKETPRSQLIKWVEQQDTFKPVGCGVAKQTDASVQEKIDLLRALKEDKLNNENADINKLV